jgi:hypothetical protein
MIWANIVAPAGTSQELSSHMLALWSSLTSVSMERRTTVSEISQNPMMIDHLRIDDVHYTIYSLKERVTRKVLLDNWPRWDTICCFCRDIVWWRMSDESHGEKDNQQIQPNCCAGYPSESCQGSNLTQDDSTVQKSATNFAVSITVYLHDNPN